MVSASPFTVISTMAIISFRGLAATSTDSVAPEQTVACRKGDGLSGFRATISDRKSL